jgi:hypothetical protein
MQETDAGGGSLYRYRDEKRLPGPRSAARVTSPHREDGGGSRS